MAQQGAALQSYNNELVKSIEALLQRRATLNKAIEAESLEKSRLEDQRRAVEERLASVDASLQTKLDQRAEYDKVIGEAEKVNLEECIDLSRLYPHVFQAYVKILESSQLLLNVVKVKSSDLASGKKKQTENKESEKKTVNTVSSSTENLFSQQLPQ